MIEPLKVKHERPENEIEAYGIYEEILSADKTEICKTRKEIRFTEDSAEFSLKLECAYYEGYDDGYTRNFIEHGRVYEKDGVQVKLYWKKIKLIVEEE